MASSGRINVGLSVGANGMTPHRRSCVNCRAEAGVWSTVTVASAAASMPGNPIGIGTCHPVLGPPGGPAEAGGAALKAPNTCQREHRGVQSCARDAVCRPPKARRRLGRRSAGPPDGTDEGPMAEELHHPHDAPVRTVLSDVTAATSFLQAHLAPAVSQRVDW